MAAARPADRPDAARCGAFSGEGVDGPAGPDHDPVSGCADGSAAYRQPARASVTDGRGGALMGFSLSARSLLRLEGVHPRLVAVAREAIALSPVDFMITEG